MVSSYDMEFSVVYLSAAGRHFFHRQTAGSFQGRPFRGNLKDNFSRYIRENVTDVKVLQDDDKMFLIASRDVKVPAFKAVLFSRFRAVLEGYARKFSNADLQITVSFKKREA